MQLGCFKGDANLGRLWNSRKNAGQHSLGSQRRDVVGFFDLLGHVRHTSIQWRQSSIGIGFERAAWLWSDPKSE
jgi:hypothetical protein